MASTWSGSTAVLFHLLDWQLSHDEVPIADGIVVGRLRDSNIGTLYERLSISPELRFAAEGGSPFGFTAYARFDTPPVDPAWGLGEPFSTVDRLCTLLAVLIGQPLGVARAIRSTDGFASASDTQIMYNQGAQSEFLMDLGSRKISSLLLADLREGWSTLQGLWHKNSAQGRIANALAFFYYAWRADYLEHTCLNLAICIEMLFAPHSMGETTHQIAYNVAHFLGSSASERSSIYELAKNFYGVRSSIIHGGMPSPGKVENATVTGFALTCRILHKFLTSSRLAGAFEDEPTRRGMLKSFLFGPQEG